MTAAAREVRAAAAAAAAPEAAPGNDDMALGTSNS